MVDWATASNVAFTGIVSVFMALGILSLVVYLVGLYFIGQQRTESKERGTGTA